jgi:hypothetical protein
MNYILLLENEKGKKEWIETADLTIWRNPTVGKFIFIGSKEWEVKAIIPQNIKIF